MCRLAGSGEPKNGEWDYLMASGIAGSIDEACGAGLLDALIPALRASRVDPALILHEE
jgi:hypothetical protein